MINEPCFELVLAETTWTKLASLSDIQEPRTDQRRLHYLCIQVLSGWDLASQKSKSILIPHITLSACFTTPILHFHISFLLSFFSNFVLLVWYHKGHVFERWFDPTNRKVKIVPFFGLIPIVLYLSNTTVSRIVNISSTKQGLEGQSTFELFWVHFPLFRPRRIQWNWNTSKCIEAIFYEWKWNQIRFYSKKSHNYRKLRFAVVSIAIFLSHFVPFRTMKYILIS